MMEKETGRLEGNRFQCMWEITRPSDQGQYVPPDALYQRYLIVTTAASSSIRYRNAVTGSVQNDVPSPTLGGLLADSMGLGKSLVALSVVAADVATARASKIQHAPTLVVAPTSSKSP